MIIQNDNETRLVYLLRVAEAYIEANPYHIISYDGTECDGYCLAEELRDQIEETAEVIRAQEAEIERLREYEFMYKELCN